MTAVLTTGLSVYGLTTGRDFSGLGSKLFFGMLALIAASVVGIFVGGSMLQLAIPIEQVKITADQILRTGEARYPVIGAKVVTGGTDDVKGAEISEVLPGTPAEDAGLERLFFELTTGGASPQSPQTDSIRPELAGATA